MTVERRRRSGVAKEKVLPSESVSLELEEIDEAANEIVSQAAAQVRKAEPASTQGIGF